VLLLNISTTKQACSPLIAEVFDEFAQAAFVFLRLVISFHFCPRHWMWLGQFQSQPNPDADSYAWDYTITYSSSNSHPVTISYAHAGAF
jgi:N-acetylneuraminic acid mutarotase